MSKHKVIVGNLGVLKNMGSHKLNGCPVQVTEIREDSEGTIITVRTMQCVGASPAGVEYDVHPYEFEYREVMSLGQ